MSPEDENIASDKPQYLAGLMRPEHSETKAKTETRECETEIETETKNLS